MTVLHDHQFMVLVSVWKFQSKVVRSNNYNLSTARNTQSFAHSDLSMCNCQSLLICSFTLHRCKSPVCRSICQYLRFARWGTTVDLSCFLNISSSTHSRSTTQSSSQSQRITTTPWHSSKLTRTHMQSLSVTAKVTSKLIEKALPAIWQRQDGNIWWTMIRLDLWDKLFADPQLFD